MSACGRRFHSGADTQKEVLTFAEFFEGHYLPYVKPRKRSWLRDDELYRLRIKEVFGSKRLNQITRQQLQSFHTALLEKGLAHATCDHHLKLLKHAFNLAIDWGLTDSNPAVRVPMFNRDNKVEHYLDGAQLERLLTVLRDDANRAVCGIALFLLSTGCRLNEALSATWEQVNLQNRVWRIPALNSKSKRIRSVPLNDTAIEILSRLDTVGENGYLFVNKQTGKPYTTIMKVWSRLRSKAELPHLRIHDLRHQFASFLVNGGRTLYEVQTILGHSDSKVTQRYAHLSSRSLQDAAEYGVGDDPAGERRGRGRARGRAGLTAGRGGPGREVAPDWGPRGAAAGHSRRRDPRPLSAARARPLGPGFGPARARVAGGIPGGGDCWSVREA